MVAMVATPMANAITTAIRAVVVIMAATRVILADHTASIITK
jgi:hypothetical protein